MRLFIDGLIAFSILGLLLAPPAVAQASGQPLWVLNAGQGQALLRLGRSGEEVLALTGGYGQVGLYSDTAGNPPVPDWQMAEPGLIGSAASSDAGVYLRADLEVLATFLSEVTLHRHDSHSADALWSYTFPAQLFGFPSFGVSRDGLTVVSAWQDQVTGAHEIRLHEPTTGHIDKLVTLPFQEWVEQFALSPDGSRIAFGRRVNGGATTVVDLASGHVVFRTRGSLPLEQGLSVGGQVMALSRLDQHGRWHIVVFGQRAGGYARVMDIEAPGGAGPRDWAVSDDGSTVVVGWFDPALPGQALVEAFDVATRSRTMQRAFIGPVSGGHTNRPTDVAVSADGTRFALGITGAEAGPTPELTLFARDSAVPLAKYPFRGSVLELDLSANGRMLVATRTPQHVNDGFLFTLAELYRPGL